MTYSKTIKKEMAWSIGVDRLLHHMDQVTEEDKEQLINHAIAYALKKIEEDKKKGAISKRQATAAKKAVADYTKELKAAPISRKENA